MTHPMHGFKTMQASQASWTGGKKRRSPPTITSRRTKTTGFRFQDGNSEVLIC
jgi:hypothetical protein